MRPVVNIAAKQMSEQIRVSFVETGQARGDVDELTMSVAEWRSTARRVARELGRPVQTLSGGSQVFAVLRDWPATEAERAITDAAKRRTVDAVSTLFEAPRI